MEDIKKNDIDAAVYKKLLKTTVPMLPTDIANGIKGVTRQAVTGALRRLQSRGRVRKLEGGEWEPMIEQVIEELKADVIEKTESIAADNEKINGGLLWDTYYALRGDESDVVIKSVLSDSAYELLGSIAGMLTPGEAIALQKGLAIGIALMKKED